MLLFECDAIAFCCPQARTGKPPSAYVQYTFPLQAPCFTFSVPRNSDPVFEDSRVFAVAVNPTLIAHLKATPLRFIVFDDDDGAVRDTRVLCHCRRRPRLSSAHCVPS